MVCLYVYCVEFIPGAFQPRSRTLSQPPSRVRSSTPFPSAQYSLKTGPWSFPALSQ